jgi:hypothetical protein
MKDWLAVFAIALVVVVGFASGPFGTVIFLLAWLTARYLLSAREVGHEQAWNKLDIAALSPPLWQRRNWEKLETIFNDGEKFWKASTVALGLTAAWLILPPIGTSIIAVAMTSWYLAEIARANNPLSQLPAKAQLDGRGLLVVARQEAGQSSIVATAAATSADAPAPTAPLTSPASEDVSAVSTPATTTPAHAAAIVTPKLPTAPAPVPQPPAITASATAESPATPTTSAEVTAVASRDAPNRHRSPRKPARQRPLRRQQRLKQRTQGKLQRNARQQPKRTNRRPEQPLNLNRPLRKQLQQRPLQRQDRPTRRPLRLVIRQPLRRRPRTTNR